MALIRLIVILAVVTAGYWTYYVFAAADPYDRIGVALNAHLPQPAREYGCTELFKRHAAAAPAPQGCEGLWGPEKL